MMKQIIALLFCFMTLSMARRSSPVGGYNQPPNTNVRTNNRGIHRMGWGLDEEYIQQSDDNNSWETVKPVARTTTTIKKEQKREQNSKTPSCNGIWGVKHVCDVEDMLGE